MVRTACVIFCVVNLFNKETVTGEKEFRNFAYINLLFTLGMGVGIMLYGFNEAAQLRFQSTSSLGIINIRW